LAPVVPSRCSGRFGRNRVWYEALRERSTNGRTFVEVKMKSGDFYTGEIKSYGIVADSERNKDFLLIKVAHKKQQTDTYVSSDADGILFNFAHAESLSFINKLTPQTDLRNAN
jgi:hypothetical protein